MKNTKKILTGILALSVAGALAACGDDDSSSGGSGGNDAAETTTQQTTTTTAATVEVNTETLAAEEQSDLEKVMEQLPDQELENKEIKYLAHYDIAPHGNGASKKVELEMFEQKYGGSLKWYETTWDNRWNDLSTYVLGGEGIDFYVSDTENLPGKIVSGMFTSVDEYIDLDGAIWQNTAAAMDVYKFGSKHYMFVTNTRADYYIYYNKATIEANGLDDPWELYEAGNWNWDTFKNMLTEFVDEENDQWGLDNWYISQALQRSAGVPTIGTDDAGNLVCNINDPTVEKAMNFQYELAQDGLILPFEQFEWNIQPAMMGEGRELFWIGGYWEAEGDPSLWQMGISPENLGVVPIPNPADADKPYHTAVTEGYVLCKGASNPEGVARFSECTILANSDPSTVAINDRKMMDDNQYSQELVDHLHIINDLAKENPVIDLAVGVSTDVADLTYNGQACMKLAYQGTDWATTREAYYDTVNLLVEEVNEQLQAKIAEEG